MWQVWRDKITSRSDYHLFNNKRPYVHTTTLAADHIRLRFNECQNLEDCGPFVATCHIHYASEAEEITWHSDAFVPAEDLIIELPEQVTGYTVQFLLDGDLAYAGRYRPELVIL
jgi:hypothetical protein